MQSLEQRMAARIPWASSDPSAVLRTGERAALALSRRSGDIGLLIQEGIERSPFSALMLARMLTRRGLLQLDMTDKITDTCRKQLEQVLAGPPAEQLCAALLILGLREEAARALTFCLPPEQPLDEDGLALIRRLRGLLSIESGSAFALQIDLLTLCYRLYPLRWNEQLLYKYGMELPSGGRVSPALRDLVHRAEQDRAYRYLNNLFALLVDLQPAELGMDPVALTERAFSVCSPEIFRALLFCRKVFDFESDGLERWWAVLQRHWEDPNRFWQSLRGWFILYYVSRKIRSEPARAREFMAPWPQLPPPPPGKPYQKTSRVMQKTITALLYAPGKSVLDFLRWSAAYNPFRFRPEEELIPYSYPNQHLNLESAFRFQHSQGCTSEELVFLYMNTFARCQMSVHQLGRVLRTDPQLLPNQYGTAAIEKLFAPYPLRATLVRQGDSCMVRPVNVRVPGDGLLLIPPDWVSARQALFDAAFPDGAELRCVLFRLYVASGHLYAKPLFDREQNFAARQRSREAFAEFCDLLGRIADTGDFDPAIKREIERLGLPQNLSPRQFVRMEQLIVACCASLLKYPGRARYFILMFSNLNRGHLNRYRFPCQSDRQRTSTYVDKQLFTDCRRLWHTIRTLDCTREELFFIYINTPFKLCVSFSELMRLFIPSDADRADLRQILTQPYVYWFAGVVSGRISADASPLGQDCLTLHPLEFSAGPAAYRDQYLFPIRGPQDELKPGDTLYAFRIGEYLPSARVFVLDELALASDRRRISPKAVFMEALSRASCTAEPDAQVRRDLGLFSGPLTWEDRTELLTMTLQALCLRARSAAALEEFLTELGPNNPWPDAPDTGRDEWEANLSRNSLLNELVRLLARYQDVETSLRVYFSSVLRAVLPLNQLLGACAQAGRSLLLLPEQLKAHPLTLYFGPDARRPSGFRTGGWQLTDPAPDNGSLTARVTGYDPKTDQLLLQSVEA